MDRARLAPIPMVVHSGSAVGKGSGVLWPLAPVIVLLAWWTARLAVASDPWCFLDFVNLAFHEAGHLVFAPLGSTLHVLGGTLGQLAVPLLLAVTFLFKERRPLGGAFCAWWFGENLVSVSRYMADARSLELPLVGGGDHDWNELFYRFGLLGEGSVAAVSRTTHGIGVLLMLGGVAWCLTFVLPSRARSAVCSGITGRFPSLGFLFD